MVVADFCIPVEKAFYFSKTWLPGWSRPSICNFARVCLQHHTLGKAYLALFFLFKSFLCSVGQYSSRSWTQFGYGHYSPDCCNWSPDSSNLNLFNNLNVCLGEHQIQQCFTSCSPLVDLPNSWTRKLSSTYSRSLLNFL